MNPDGKTGRVPESAQAAIEGRTPETAKPDERDAERDAKRSQTAPKPSGELPPAGPHADPSLVNPDATPGTGALTPPGEHDDTDSTSG